MPSSAGPVPAFLAGGGEMGGRIRDFDWRATPLGDPAGWPAGLRTVVRTMLTTHHPQFVFWGADAICLYNDAYRRSIGPEKHPAILGRPARDAWADLWPIVGPQIDHVMSGRGSTWHENQRVPMLRHGRVEDVWWTYSYGPIDDDAADSGIGGVLVLCTETTGQIAGQQRLAAAEARWRSLFEQTPGFVCILDGPEHRFEFANAPYLALVGGRDVIGKTVADALPEVVAQGFIGLLDDVYRSGEAFHGRSMRLELDAGDGAQTRYVDFVYQPVRDDAGAVRGVFVQGSDVTDRVAAAVALADSQARWRALAEQLPGGAVFVVDRDLRYRMAGGEALATLGVESSEFVGRTIADVVGRDAAGFFEPHYRRALAGEAFEVEHREGERYYLTRGTPLRADDGSVYAALAASYDITARRAVEEELRRASARLDGVMAAADVGVWSWDLHDAATPDAPVAVDAEHAVYDVRAMAHATLAEHLATVHPDDRAAVHAAVAAARAGERYDVREYRVRGAAGAWRWLAGRGRLQRDAGGRPQQLTGLVIDITELKRLEQTLQDSDRRKDEFLATLAHELRNPLAPLLSAARLLATAPPGSDELVRCRDVIRRQVNNMALLLDDLLDLSRVKHGRLRLAVDTVTLASIVDAALETAQPLIDARGHRLTIDLPTAPVTLRADPSRVAQVLANLLGNAAKYTDAGGRIELAARVGSATVAITVRDNGVGLAAGDRERIFDMFSQLDAAAGGRAAQGLGIGLALVRGLVELHGGRVGVDSDGPGRGSTFRVELPLAVVDAGAPAPTTPTVWSTSIAAPAAPAERGQRVLVADDNVDAAQTLAMLLQLHGHDTRVAHDGRAALAAFAAFAPDVALLDIGMPELNGFQVAERIRAQPRGADVRLVALTGWGQDHDRREALAAGFDRHFTKPVDPDALLRLIDEAR